MLPVATSDRRRTRSPVRARVGRNRLFRFRRMGNGRIPSLNHRALRDPCALSGDCPLFCRNPMEPVPTCDAGFRTACCATRRRVPRPTTFLAGFASPDTPFHGPEAGKRRSEARSRAPEPGGRGPEGRFQGLEGGMNGPVAGIRASEARVSHRVGGKRTKLGRARTKADRDQSPGHAPGSENPRDARSSHWGDGGTPT